MCVCVCVCVCVIRYYRQSLSAYFFFNTFKLAYSCFDIQLEFSLFNGFPSTFVPLLGPHQGVYIAKSTIQYFIYTDVNFFCKLIPAGYQNNYTVI